MPKSPPAQNVQTTNNNKDLGISVPDSQTLSSDTKNSKKYTVSLLICSYLSNVINIFLTAYLAFLSEGLFGFQLLYFYSGAGHLCICHYYLFFVYIHYTVIILINFISIYQVYKVAVETNGRKWFVLRRYNEFHTLYDKVLLNVFFQLKQGIVFL